MLDSISPNALRQYRMKEDSKLDYNLEGDLDDRFDQIHRIHQMKATLGALVILSVEGTIEIGVREGHGMHQGHITALNSDSFRIADSVLTELPFELKCFAEKYPLCSFTITYEQRHKHPDEE